MREKLIVCWMSGDPLPERKGLKMSKTVYTVYDFGGRNRSRRVDDTRRVMNGDVIEENFNGIYDRLYKGAAP